MIASDVARNQSRHGSVRLDRVLPSDDLDLLQAFAVSGQLGASRRESVMRQLFRRVRGDSRRGTAA